MSLIDIFNPSFLLFLGILVLVAAVLVVYFESKLREQNHKISSMFSIVSTLAEDLNSVKFGMNQLAFNGGGPSLAENMNYEENKLIQVSDDEEESDSDEEDDSDEEEYDEEDDDDSDEDDEEDEEENLDNIKILKISDPLLDPLLEKVEQNFDELEPLSDPLLEKVEQTLDYDYEQEPLQLVESDFIKNEKSIKIDLGDDSTEYKKLSLQKLKSIVTEKGLATDTSKLKKPDLLKLLGVE